MSELEQVERLASEKRRAQSATEAERTALAREIRHKQEFAVLSLNDRLTKIGAELRPRMRIYVRSYTRPEQLNPMLVVAISSAPTWLRRPFVEYSFSPALGVGITCRFDVAQTTGARNGKRSGMLSEDEVVELLRGEAADFINAGTQFEFVSPRWYSVFGAVLGWPLTAATWLICTVLFGWLGLFLGWIPSWLVLQLSRVLWPLIIGGLALLLSQ